MKKLKNYIVCLSLGKKELKYLGLYNTVEEAFNVYKTIKENYIKEVANKYKNNQILFYQKTSCDKIALWIKNNYNITDIRSPIYSLRQF